MSWYHARMLLMTNNIEQKGTAMTETLAENGTNNSLEVFTPELGLMTFPPLDNIGEGTKAEVFSGPEEGQTTLMVYPIGTIPKDKVVRIPGVPGVIQVLSLTRWETYWNDGVRTPQWPYWYQKLFFWGIP